MQGEPSEHRYLRTVEDLDDDGKAWRVVHYARDGSVQRMYETLATDPHGRVVEQRIYYDDYEEPVHLRFRYEDRGFYVIQRELAKPDEVAAVLKYDDRRRLVLQVWINKFMTYVYTDDGRLSESRTHHVDGRTTRLEYAYDDALRLRTVKRSESHRPGWTVKALRYDARGRQREMTRTDESGVLLEKCEFEYQRATPGGQ